MNGTRHRGDIIALQGVRAIAATAVVCHHAFRAGTIYRPPQIILNPGTLLPDSWFVDLGAFGVDLFFVLSGFLMVLISGPYFQGLRSAGYFLTKRFFRIWPLYAIFTTYAIFRETISAHPHSAAFDLRPLRLLSYFFVPSFDAHGLVAPPVGVGWTLNYEVLFYICFATTIAARLKRPILALIAILSAVYFCGLVKPSSALGAFFHNDLVFEFVLGSCFGSAFLRGWHPSYGRRWIVAGCILMVGAHSISVALPRVISAGLAATLILIGVVALDPVARTPSWLVKAGDASYSIYLSHIFIAGAVVNRVLPDIVRSPASEFAIAIAGFCAVAVCIAAGCLIHVCVERPLLRFLSNFGAKAPFVSITNQYGLKHKH